MVLLGAIAIEDLLDCDLISFADSSLQLHGRSCPGHHPLILEAPTAAMMIQRSARCAQEGNTEFAAHALWQNRNIKSTRK